MLSLEEKHDWLRAYSPTNLRYVAAIRGYVPANHGQGFTYAQLNCGSGSTLIALAAANPEGVFFGFDADADKLNEASASAAECSVDNVKFVQADHVALSDALQSGAIKPAFDYVVAHLAADDRAADLQANVTLAGNLVAAGGLCYVAYPVTAPTSDSLSAALAGYQAGATNTDMAHAAASAGQLVFAGSAKLKNNFIEFSVHPDHHAILTENREAPAFESLKDIAMGVRIRHDLWVKPGAEKSENIATLLQTFSFGMAAPASYINPQFKYFDKKLDLTTPLFTRLLTVLADTAYSIGDIIAHPDFQNAAQDEIVGGIQMLAAIGMIEPVRGGAAYSGAGDFNNPHFVTSYNQRLRNQDIGDNGAMLAAPMLGRPVLGTAPMMMTLQSLDQGGLAGAEEILDGLLLKAPAAVKTMIGADLDDSEARRNTAYRLLEQTVQNWLLFCYVNGIMQPSA